jgi:hypothetical protein
VYSCSADSTIACFDRTSNKLVSQVAAPEVPYVLKSDSSGRLFASGGAGGLMVLEPFSEAPPLQFGCHDGVVSCLRVVNQRVITDGLDRFVDFCSVLFWLFLLSLCSTVAVWERTPDARFVVSMKLSHLHGNCIVRKLRADPFGFHTGGYDGRVVETDFRDQQSDQKTEKTTGCQIA